jgi:tetratricopeptide (TPR) repeat protein
MGEYRKALSFHEKHLIFDKKTHPPNYPDPATSHNDIAAVYYYEGQYSNALSYFQRAQNIWRTSLSSNHPSIKNVQGSIKHLKRNRKLTFDE